MRLERRSPESWGLAEILADRAGEEEREFVRLIHRSGERLMETLNSLIDLAQLESREQALKRETFELAASVRETVDLFQLRAQEKNLWLRLIAPENPVFTCADSGALGRVLDNVVGNAIKFTHVGGVTVCVHEDGSHAEISVIDTGIGIGPKFRDRIFDQFTQESEAFTREFEGIGLGLSISKELLKLMGGTIGV